jgi:hypothetical protein
MVSGYHHPAQLSREGRSGVPLAPQTGKHQAGQENALNVAMAGPLYDFDCK